MFLSLLLAASTFASDTIDVPSAKVEGPFPLRGAFQTDSVNMKGKTIDLSETLQQNAALATKHSSRTKNLTTINRNERLNVGSDSLATLRFIRFSVETPRYIKAELKIEKLGNYKCYVNGTEKGDKQLKLTPGRSEIALQVLTEKTSNDTFRISIVGDSLAGLRVNPTGKRPYTMAEMLQGDHYRSVDVSPTGKYLVTIIYNTDSEGHVRYRTTLTEIETGRVLRCWNEYIALSWLDGEKDVLHYTRNIGSGRELVLFRPEDGTETILADHIPDGSFRISPKGDYIIFNHSEEGIKPSGALKRLDQPDDRMAGWRNRNALWRYDLKSGVFERITFGSHAVYLDDISADGNHLLLQYSDFNATYAPFNRTSLLRMNAYTGKVDTLLADTAFIASARFSPDGNRLLISGSPGAFGGIGSELPSGHPGNAFDYRLYAYDIAQRSVKPLLCGFAPSVDSYEWNKGDGMIYMLTSDGTGRTLYRLNPENGQTVRYEMPVSYIQDYSIAHNGRNPQFVLFGQSGERAREMFTGKLDGKATPTVRPIGEITFDKVYGDVAIGKCNNWQFQAERGDTIDGFYILPPDFEKDKKYPMIVYYYGGVSPTTQCLEYQYPLQILAGQGYVVYVPNPSGTVGYGQEFAARHVNTWGRESGDDIIQGTKAFLSSHPFVDPSRVGCIGASYGGFMTQYLQTRTDIFAAAVSHAGISNIASYWGGGYWGYSYGEAAQYGSYPWNNPKLYVEQSPLFNADKIHTPLLLMHGTVDTNVPTNESQQLYNALKILGRDVCYIQVEGENHVITDFKKRLAWQDAIFAWFAKYLQGDENWWKSLQSEM